MNKQFIRKLSDKQLNKIAFWIKHRGYQLAYGAAPRDECELEKIIILRAELEEENERRTWEPICV